MENSTPKAVFVCVDDKPYLKTALPQPPEFGHFLFTSEHGHKSQRICFQQIALWKQWSGTCRHISRYPCPDSRFLFWY